MTRPLVITGIVVVQALCALLFVGNIVTSVLGLPPISWTAHELIELGASLGLVLGTVLGGVALRRGLRRAARMEKQLRAASGAFMELLDERFDEWGLTAAERDVALFSIKGLSTGEIAALRNTSEGTVKAQTAAIYRKAGVSGRAQLLSLFIEELMSATPLTRPEAGQP